MTSCMRLSRALDNPPVLITCFLHSASSVWCCSSSATMLCIAFSIPERDGKKLLLSCCFRAAVRRAVLQKHWKERKGQSSPFIMMNSEALSSSEFRSLFPTVGVALSHLANDL